MMRVAVMVLLSIAAWAGDKDKPVFKPGPASSYPGFQALDKITLAAAPFITEEQAQPAFGKVNPYAHGILPVLVVLANGKGKALPLDFSVEIVFPPRPHLAPTPPS